MSYNLKKLVEIGYMHHQRCSVDRRAVRVRLTPQGQAIRARVADLFARQAKELDDGGIITFATLDETVRALRRLERFWGDQIRYILLGRNAMKFCSMTCHCDPRPFKQLAGGCKW